MRANGDRTSPREKPISDATLVMAGVAGAVLAGGSSRRMGRDKALAVVDGVPMIERVCGVLRGRVAPVIVAGGYPKRYAFVGCRVVPDEMPGLGPLAGIYTALRCVHTPWCVVVACDMPRLQPEVIDAIAAARRPNVDAVVADAGRGLEPLCAAYHQRVIAGMSDQLRSGHLAVHDWIASLAVAVVPLAGPLADAITNVNTSEDLKRARGCSPGDTGV